MNILITLLFIFVSFLGGWLPQLLFAATLTGQTIITGTVPGCGDGVIQTGESCDGSNLNGQSCSTQGFFGGTLSCNSNCTFNTSACTFAPPPSGGGGGGGGGHIAPITQVVFSGRAYPKSTITLLKDAQIAATTVADANANFQISVSGISGGNYIFSVYSEDDKGIRSSLLTFLISVTSGVTTKVGGIFIAPTIAVDKSEVRRGDDIAIFGQSAPNSEITIEVNSEDVFFNKVNADKDGVYLFNFDTTPLEMGQRFTRSKAAYNGEISSFSKSISFLVGTKNVAAELLKAVIKGDLNNDKRVNLVDFSIAAYWYKRPNPPATSDLNGDGKVDLVDFSIMAFYWTG